MTCKPLVAIALIAGCLPALAQQQIPSVEVTATPVPELQFACGNVVAPSRADIEQLLRINDNRQTHALGQKLLGAVGEACDAGIARIEVQRGAAGQSLTWRRAADDNLRAIALN
jgi:hypothetical protein